jgi:hypothetical protein
LAIKEDAKLKKGSFNNAVVNEALEKDIDLITEYLSRPYFNSALKKLSKENPNNAKLNCDYIITEQTEFNIEKATKEITIK